MNKAQPRHMAYEHKDKKDGDTQVVANDTIVHDQRDDVYYELNTDERKLIRSVDGDKYNLSTDYKKQHPVPLSAMAILEENNKLNNA